MSTSVVWTDPAVRDLERHDSRTAQRVRRAVVQLAGDRRGDLKKLKGTDDSWRLRVGEYRVILSFDHDQITVYRVLPRQSAYRE